MRKKVLLAASLFGMVVFGLQDPWARQGTAARDQDAADREALLPDLVVRKVLPTGQFEAGAIVSNVGKNPSAECLLLLTVFDRDRDILWEQKEKVAALAPGAFARVTFDTEPQSLLGHRYQLRVDSDDRVRESDEYNNRSSVIETPALLPDLEEPTKPRLRLPDREGGSSGVGRPAPKAPSPEKLSVTAVALASRAPVDLAATGLMFQSRDGKDYVVGVIRNVDDKGHAGTRSLTLVRVARMPGKDVTEEIGSVSQLPSLAPGEEWRRAFPRPSSVEGASGYVWRLMITPADANPGNDAFEKTTTVTRFD